jgi:prepilin-type N-terminal cleavage/methylation domain-containing protein
LGGFKIKHQVKHNQAFSLFETLVVLAITGIILGFAIVTYQKPILKSQAGIARLALLDLAMHLEEVYGNEHTYEFASIPENIKAQVKDKYILNIIYANKSHFTLKATALGDKSKISAQCQEITLNNANIDAFARATEVC